MVVEDRSLGPGRSRRWEPWSTDDKRYNFQFGLEIRRDIFGGKRRLMLRQIASVEFQNSVVMSDSSPSRCRGQPTR